jgi:hypothetical protein
MVPFDGTGAEAWRSRTDPCGPARQNCDLLLASPLRRLRQEESGSPLTHPKGVGRDEYQIRSGALAARKICGEVPVTIEALDQHYAR